MNRISLILSLLSILILYPLQAQQAPLRLSLEQAQEYALEHNLSLQNARAEVGIAQQQFKEARAQGLPQLSGKLDYMTNFNYEAILEFGGGGQPQLPQIDFTKLDAGDIEVLKILEALTSSSASSTTIEMTDQSNAQLQLSQLLFSGQYWASLQTARMAEELARQSADLSALDVKESVSGTYYLILVNEALDQVLEENIDLLEEVRQHTENMFQAGLAEQTDVDQISVSLAQLRNQKQAMERGILLSYNMLRFQLGLESDREVLLTSPLSILLPAEESTRILASNFPLEQHPNFRIIQTRERLQEKQVDMEKWAYAPSLTGFYSYTEKLLTTGFDLSPNHAAGLNLSIPIFSSGMRKARLEKSKIALDQARRDREIVSEQLKLQDNQLRNELMAALDNYQLQQENVKVAARLRNSMTNKYRQGLISSLELTQANTQYLQAESNYLSAAMELLQARLKINKLYNQL